METMSTMNHVIGDWGRGEGGALDSTSLLNSRESVSVENLAV